MIELMLARTDTSLPPETGDVILYIDMASVTETVSNRPISISAGAVVSSATLIDNKPTLSMPTAGGSGSRLFMAFNPLIDLSSTNWTIEWSELRPGSATAWTNEFYMTDASLLKGFTMRFGDAGYGNQLMFADNSNGVGKSECRYPAVTFSTYNNIVTKYAMTCDSTRRLRFYINGVRQSAQAGVSGGVLSDFFQSGPASNFANLSTLYLGALNGNANNVPRFLGNVRISNYVRYTGNYTPGVV